MIMKEYFEADYFYDLAKELKKCEVNCEYSAIERTIVDRVYYSLFLSIKKFLISKGYESYDDGQDHHNIRKFIIKKQVFGKESGYVKNKLYELHNIRKHSSYILHPYYDQGITLDDIFNTYEKIVSKL